jgi:hypothetical protein
MWLAYSLVQNESLLRLAKFDACQKPAINEDMYVRQRFFILAAALFLPVLACITAPQIVQADSSALSPRTGKSIQSDDPLPMQTRRGRCNPAATRCQLPRHRVQPKDSDLNERAESGRRLHDESSLNNRSRTGPAIDSPTR